MLYRSRSAALRIALTLAGLLIAGALWWSGQFEGMPLVCSVIAAVLGLGWEFYYVVIVRPGEVLIRPGGLRKRTIRVPAGKVIVEQHHVTGEQAAPSWPYPAGYLHFERRSIYEINDDEDESKSYGILIWYGDKTLDHELPVSEWDALRAALLKMGEV